MNLGTSVYRVARELESSPRGIGIDIDDCLAQTSLGYFNLLSTQYPPPLTLTANQVQKHYSMHGKILHWGDIPEADKYAWQHADDPGFHQRLTPFPDAALHAAEIESKSLFGCYITARLETMREMTKRWLEEHGFPQKPLIMRSTDISFASHTTWKVAAIQFLQSRIYGIIDNDVRIVNHLAQESYPGRLYLLGLTPQEYSGNGSIIVKETWPEITAEILRNHS